MGLGDAIGIMWVSNCQCYTCQPRYSYALIRPTYIQDKHSFCCQLFLPLSIHYPCLYFKLISPLWLIILYSDVCSFNISQKLFGRCLCLERFYYRNRQMWVFLGRVGMKDICISKNANVQASAGDAVSRRPKKANGLSWSLRGSTINVCAFHRNHCLNWWEV